MLFHFLPLADGIFVDILATSERGRILLNEGGGGGGGGGGSMPGFSFSDVNFPKKMEKNNSGRIWRIPANNTTPSYQEEDLDARETD